MLLQIFLSDVWKSPIVHTLASNPGRTHRDKNNVYLF